ncbi:hypothetical protein [Streptomyces sp. NPDC059063]|uniref:DUF7848 domain-containing protein n=1 Tax=unclassified Streptomyces TaxID=2593676 RepID=UPI0036C6F6A4
MATYVGTCLKCRAQSPGSEHSDNAQVWCLKHAGLTKHTAYGLSVFQPFTASLTDPAFQAPPTP